MEKGTMVKVQLNNITIVGEVGEVKGSQVYVVSGKDTLKFHVDEVTVIAQSDASMASKKSSLATEVLYLVQDIADMLGVSDSSSSKICGMSGETRTYNIVQSVVKYKTDKWLDKHCVDVLRWAIDDLNRRKMSLV